MGLVPTEVALLHPCGQPFRAEKKRIFKSLIGYDYASLPADLPNIVVAKEARLDYRRALMELGKHTPMKVSPGTTSPSIKTCQASLSAHERKHAKPTFSASPSHLRGKEVEKTLCENTKPCVSQVCTFKQMISSQDS